MVESKQHNFYKPKQKEKLKGEGHSISLNEKVDRREPVIQVCPLKTIYTWINKGN